MAEHVIFLGAGASKSSGYPLANDLRLLMSSRKHLEKAINAADDPRERRRKPQIDLMLEALEESIALFRKGGFASVDEFCKLGSDFSVQDSINEMRSWTRSVLS